METKEKLIMRKKKQSTLEGQKVTPWKLQQKDRQNELFSYIDPFIEASNKFKTQLKKN